MFNSSVPRMCTGKQGSAKKTYFTANPLGAALFLLLPGTEALFVSDHHRMKKLNIGLIGYGFMGRAHSNAFRKVGNFFDLDYELALKAVCARDQQKVKAFAKKWGYETTETDWRKLIA